MLDKQGIESCTEELMGVMNKYFADDSIYCESPIAALILMLSNSKQSYPDMLNSVVESYFALEMPQFIQNIERLYEVLCEKGYSVDKKGGHGHGDSYVWPIPSENDTIKLLGYEDQNYRFIVSLRTSSVGKEVRVGATYMNGVHTSLTSSRIIEDAKSSTESEGDGYILNYSAWDCVPVEVTKVRGASLHTKEVGGVLYNIKLQKNWADEL